MSNNKIIAIEGIDGSGKSLQFDILRNKLMSIGNTCTTLSFPDYDGFFGKEIGAMLSGKQKERADEVDAKSMALWYAVDRWKCFQNLAYQQYDFVLLNRYTLSNAVFQGLRKDDMEKQAFAKWVFELEHKQLGLPQPDIYIILDVDEKLSKQNVSQKGFRDYTGNDPDVYENSENLMVNARALYLDFAKELPNISVINCFCDGKMLPPESIHHKIWDILTELGIVYRV